MHNPLEHVVLIADDDPDVRMLVTTTLGRQGYQLIEATDGAEALKVIREQSPGLALLDIDMPGLDGVQVAEQVKAEGLETPFMFVTAHTKRRDLDRALATGPVGYLAKPFPLEKLREQVRQALLPS
jgi:CheY-like chemotaxis protein